MSECFPPIPLYIVTGIIVAMFTAVASKISEDSGERDKRDAAFAAFLLIVLAIPFTQMLAILVTTVYSARCGAVSSNADAQWLLTFHAATVFLLPFGAVYWFWNLSNMGRRLHL